MAIQLEGFPFFNGVLERRGIRMEKKETRSIRTLKGVGEQRATKYAKLGIETVEDLLHHYPRSYEDWSVLTPLAEAVSDTVCCIQAEALSAPAAHYIRKGMTLYQFVAVDGAAKMKVTIFNNRFAADRIRAGHNYLFYGKVTVRGRTREMSSPEIQPAEMGASIRPVYPQTEGLSSRMIETAVRQAFSVWEDGLSDPLPEALRQEYALCHLRYAIRNVHFPKSHETLAVARRRLVFEELLVLQLGMAMLRSRGRNGQAPKLNVDKSKEFFSMLPFAPTDAQRRAVSEAVEDMRTGIPMSRLLQGDVGSGKTAVAAALCHTAAANGWQSALMAPTGILAEQHYQSLRELLEPAGIRVALLTGSTTAAQKRDILEQLKEGTIQLAVGTHALLQESVVFQNLGLVITDEQHRFGVEQRAALASKGQNTHVYVMSATPIPRTLALMIYGDLDISVLDEPPPGRKPVATYAIDSKKRMRALGFVKKHLDEGYQAYIVCPLVEEGEGDLKAAQQYARSLEQGPLRDYQIGLVHGRMKPSEKDKVMADFSSGKVQLLVSTTVIEVGVNVPNAVIMVVENAERFGLSQLHQLRGRVGRGNVQSHCILISDAQNEQAKRRMWIMSHLSDGFQIAEEDLKLRGPGDFFGQRQHGLPALKIADMASDMAVLREAQEAAHAILKDDPNLEASQYEGLRREVEGLFAQVGEQGLN